MSKKVYTCESVDISHQQMVDLRKSGHLNLGINDALSSQISNARTKIVKNKGVAAAYRFWIWISVAVFGYTIYLSFTSHWWWFLLGFIAMNVIFQANKKGNSENLLEEAMEDSEFYNQVKAFRGWVYQLDETEAEKYKIQKA